MIILGLNAYHGDSSACIVVDGKLIAAVEEERLTRIKHWAGLPVQSIKYCLQESGIRLQDVDHIAINRIDRTTKVEDIMSFAKSLVTSCSIYSLLFLGSFFKVSLIIDNNKIIGTEITQRYS